MRLSLQSKPLQRIEGGPTEKLVALYIFCAHHLYVEVISNFRRKNWIPHFVADLLNAKHGIPFLAVYRPKLEDEYGAVGLQTANEEFARLLRAMVDRWIDSGKDDQGIEEPPRRNLNGAMPEYGGTLFELVAEWNNRNPPQVLLLRTGKVTVVERTQIFPEFAPADLGKEHALFWFMELLECPEANLLARCDNPGCRARYYTRHRLRNAVIKRGAYCRKCAGVGAAKRTIVSRNAKTDRLVALAADVWPHSWKPSARYRKKSEFVVAKMKQRVKRSPLTITGKWVSQNRDAIQAELKRREDAKG